MDVRDPETATAVDTFLTAVLERYAAQVAVVKPQSAFYEQLGWRGIEVLQRIVARARELGLLVLLDAKRGDIDSTAAAYAAYLNPSGALPVDAITVNPYLGTDTLRPFIDAAREHDAGLFVLVKTSNPGAGDYQDRTVGQQRLFEVVAESLRPAADSLRGPQTGWSSLGVVVGATHPGDALRVRDRLPHALFLVPGYGAQGGGAQAALGGFVRGPTGRLEGGIVNSSRAALFPAGSDTADLHTWEKAIDSARDRAIAELSAAVS
jgi:orotidine-5'-phosphate decarboxylase